MLNVCTSVRHFVVAVFLALAVIGCTSQPKGPSRTAKAVESFKSVKADLTKGTTQIDITLASLTTLTAKGADVPTAYKAYVENVAKIKGMADKAHGRVESMKANAEDYIAQWQMEMTGISDEDLRARSAKRMEEARSEFQKVRDATAEVRKAYDPFMADLMDVQTFLANDLTQGGIDAVEGKAKSAAGKGKTLKDKIAALQKELDALASKWAAPAPPKAAS